MSTLTLKGLTSGSSVLKAPDSGSNEVTFTMPASAGTLATTADVNAFDPDGAVTINDTGADVDFRVESDGNANMLFVDGGEDAVLIGHNASDGKGASLQIHGTGGHALEISRWSDSANGVNLTLTKSRGASVGTEGIVSDGDTAGQIAWNVDDGTDQASQIAFIKAAVDGTPGANDTPGRLVFSTTPDGSDSTTERMRIDSSGNVGIGVTPDSMWANNRAIRLGSGACINARSNDADRLEMSANQYTNTSGTDSYITTGAPASMAVQDGGAHTFRVAPTNTGSAGDAISWNTAMTIGNDGNVGIGVTPETQNTFTTLQIENGVMGGSGNSHNFHTQNAYYNSGWKYYGSDPAAKHHMDDGKHTFEVAASGSADAAITWTTAMTIENDGDITIGSTGNKAVIQNGKSGDDLVIDNSSNGGIVYQADANGHTFKTYSGSWINAMIIDDNGTVTKPSQPAFAVNIDSTLTNVVGGAVDYTIGSASTATESYDVGGNITNFLFTAPVTGKYHLSGALAMEGAESGNEYGFGQLVTSNRSYMFAHSYDWWDWYGDDGGSWISQSPFSFVVDMDSGDTAYLRVKIWGGSTTIDIIGSTMFQGYLLG